MKKNFLVGNFLSAYASAYTYGQARPSAKPSLSPEELEARFAARTLDYRSRQQQHTLRLLSGFVAALVVVTSAFHLPLERAPRLAFHPLSQPTVVLEEIIQTRQQVVPPPPPRPVVPVVVPDDEILEDDALVFDALLDVDQPLAALPPPPPVSDEEEEEDTAEEELFVAVEHMPEIIGGWQRLAEDLTYPEVALKAGIEGMVLVQIIVDKEGNPEQPQVLKSPSEVLDEAAVAAVMKQRFKPALQRHRPVAVRIAIPVRFRLN